MYPCWVIQCSRNLEIYPVGIGGNSQVEEAASTVQLQTSQISEGSLLGFRIYRYTFWTFYIKGESNVSCVGLRIGWECHKWPHCDVFVALRFDFTLCRIKVGGEN